MLHTTLGRAVAAAFVMCWLGPATLGAQTAWTAQSAYDHLQYERNRARALYEGDAPDPDSVAAGIAILREALAVRNSSEVSRLAEDSPPLYYRLTDLSFDLAVAYSRAGRLDEAARAAEVSLASEYGGAYAGAIDGDSLLRPLRTYPALAPHFARVDAGRRLFGSQALATPYRPDIPAAEKVAGLSALWSAAKYNFAFFDQVPRLDWDSLYLATLPAATSTTNTVDYLRVLQHFVAQLGDGHTDVYPEAGELQALTRVRPPLGTRLIDGRVFVHEVYSDSLRGLGIVEGVELLGIDGEDVHAYAAREVDPYVSASTDRDRAALTYTYNLLRGSEDRPVALAFVSPSGKTFSHTLPRRGYGEWDWPRSLDFGVLPGNVGHLTLRSFADQALPDSIAAVYDAILATDALVIDVRGNGGGDGGIAYDLLARLVDTGFVTGASAGRVHEAMTQANVPGITFGERQNNTWSVHGPEVETYRKPVAVLIDGRTFSAAEDFALAFDIMGRGTLVGETTGGSTGNGVRLTLPGGIGARIVVKRDSYPDGREWVGYGIEPDVRVGQTAEEFVRERDVALARAVELLGRR